ncbi:amino acid permease [Clostridium tagluense]|uniref:amino acid permease n=1 Tax=Clostridium tagluense TaxID=360422 RepID=UPI001CF275D5|nr:amino acid permease [Clostridium tagluense]MCB2310358.1 amino acid permease [Clostridium tagluense]MCB2315000.1 amino acid permease [Clostridium tagluense]MCB2320059.1 amino acid permease [Clostridium tagluense]MCB2324743.1 amino acid permease [Clostridium tagluense]MCB2329803.1 amino acid permease [Clostridium tagluense]
MGKSTLKKEIGLLAASAVVIGMVIGSGVFFKPTAIYTATGAPGLGMIAWIIGGLITIAGGLTAAEVAAAIPKTGGMIVWLEETYGEVWGFLLGWVETVISFPANIAALGIIFATQAVSLLGLGDEMLIIIAIISIIFLIVMNCLGAKVGGNIQTVFTIGKMVPILAIIVFGFINGNGGVVRLFPVSVATHPIATSLGSALLATMFAYDGWIHVGNIAGELKNPKKDLPKAIIGGLLFVMAAYILINMAYLFVLPASALAATKTPATDVATLLFGAAGGKVITVGILVSIFGTLNGNILTGMRVPYALALENKLPASKWLSKLTPKTSTPINSGILIGVIAIVMTLSGNFNQLTDLLVFVLWIFYVMTFIAVMVLRKKKPDLIRPYKVPLYPVIPIIAIVGGLYIIINTMFTQPLNAGLGLVVTAIGLPIYYMRKNKTAK